jgi:hypothetical protein
MRLTKELVDLAWGNYFGTSHGFAPEVMKFSSAGGPAQISA